MILSKYKNSLSSFKTLYSRGLSDDFNNGILNTSRKNISTNKLKISMMLKISNSNLKSNHLRHFYNTINR
jgi:hypothetical protein